MIKVIVADDEEKVCTLICKLADWKSLGMEVVATAYNGIQALELIKALSPDVVITDIRMPGYDGIELISKTKEINEHIEFIIISGHGHFEYAQSAIKYGVSDYLLKPINKIEFIDTLEKIRLRCLKRAEQLSVQEQLRLHIQGEVSKKREQLFTELLFSERTRVIESIEELNDTFSFNFAEGIFQLSAVKIDCPYEDFNTESIKVLYEKISNILDTLLRNSCYEMEIYCRDTCIYALLNYSLENRSFLRRQLKAVMSELLVQQTVFDDVFFTLCVGKQTDKVCELSQCVAAVENAVFQRLVDGIGKIIEHIPVEYPSIKQDSLLADFRLKQMQAAELLDVQAAVSAVDLLSKTVQMKEKTKGCIIYNLVLAAGEMFIALIKNTQYHVEIPAEAYKEFETRLTLSGTVEQLFESLKLLVGTMMDFIVQEQKQAENKPIRMAKQYIQKNYMNPISLEEISEMVGFNFSYFSVLFKKETGKNFLEYLSEVRITNAKELLRETNLSIAEIGNRVGYMDHKHFIATFKKYAGIKPGEFRKLYS